jgi:CRP/FNR family transcriptional regulator, cyclic AMP receptor protein
MMNISEARAALAARGWLSFVPAEFRTEILSHVTLHAFDRGDWIFEQDKPAGGMWGIAAGMAAISIRSEEQPDAAAHIQVAGQWTGAAALILGSQRLHGLRCLAASQMVFLSSRAIEKIAAQMPDAWRWIGALPAMNMQLAFMTVEDLLIPDPRRRCAAILLRLAGCRGPFRGTVPDEIPLSQDQLGQTMNMSRTVLGEVLRELERAGAIARNYKRIQVHPKSLMTIAMGRKEGMEAAFTPAAQ